MTNPRRKPGINIVRTPVGKIKIVRYHKGVTGRVYSIGEEYDYYGIMTTKRCNCQGGGVIQKYRLLNESIPLNKAVVLK